MGNPGCPTFCIFRYPIRKNTMLRTDSEKAKKKGRAYRCTRCNKMGNQVIDVKYRVADHILKYHLSLDQVPYYCTLCLFRCNEESQLLQHVSKYKRHQMLTTEKGIIDSSPYLVRNPHPYVVGDGDMEAMSQKESHNIFLQRVRPTSATITRPVHEEEPTVAVSTGLDESFDSLEAYVTTLISPVGPLVAEKVSKPRQSDTVVQVSADFLASLLKNQTSAAASQASSMPPASIPRQSDVLTQNLSHLSGLAHPNLPPANGTPRRIVLQVPDDPAYTQAKMPQTTTQGAMMNCVNPGPTLNTPRIGYLSVQPTPLLDEKPEEENILPQLLGSIETSTPAITPQRLTTTFATASTQCTLQDETPAWVSIAQTLATKMADNIDSNTRTLRVLEKTTLSMRDTLDNLTRLVRKLSDEKSKPTQTHSRDESDNDRGDKKRKSKENHEGHSMQSVLGRVYPENKRQRH